MSDKKTEITSEPGFDDLRKLSGADFNLQLRAYEGVIRKAFEGAPYSRACKVTIANADMWAFQSVLTIDPNIHINDTLDGYTSFFVLADKESSVRNTLRCRGVKSF